MKITRKKVIAILPAYNAERTLEKTLAAIPRDYVDDVILCDDGSKDKTVELSRSLGIKTFVHRRNQGYGANQKTCYREALKEGGEIAVMVHPDFQYDPKFIPDMIAPILEGKADAVFGSRMVYPKNALNGGMPKWKWVANILLTKLENLCLGLDLTEYHSGFRAYSKKVLDLPIELNSDNFVFDTEIIVQMKLAGLRISEIPITTRYFPEASMIGFKRSVRYGLSILVVLVKYFLHKIGIKMKQFKLDRVRFDAVCGICGHHKSVIVKEPRGAAEDMFAGPYRATEENTGVHGEIRECMKCHISYVPQTEKLKATLDKYYQSAPLDVVFVADEKGRRSTASRIISEIESINKSDEEKENRRILDFGANAGLFLAEARDRGWQAFGIEASSAQVKFAKEKYNLNIEQGGYAEFAKLASNSFDAIVALDVLEHLGDPMKFVNIAKDKLKIGGALAITVPDINSFGARVFGEHWGALVPGHLFFFSSYSLAYIAAEAGLEIAKSKYYRRAFSINYILSRLFKKPNFKLPLLGGITVPLFTFDEPEVYMIKK